MVELWFAIAAMMLTAYVVLDGFDLGAGALHAFVARTDQERRQVLAAIGPYWDGNEVWLIATGGVLFVAFPSVLASGLSGFYFAIFLVLWCLLLRGISIEFRSHIEHSLWRAAWDFVFCAASTLLPILFGAALGNLLRGLPIDRDGYFSLALFTDFSARRPVGILDWYTILAGIFGILAIAGHGGTFLAWKTDGKVQERSRRAAVWLYGMVAVLWPLVTVLTGLVNTTLFAALPRRPVAWLSLLIAITGLVTVGVGLRGRKDFRAFLGSCAFLMGMLAATAACVFPVMLRAIDDDTRTLTAYNASVPTASLQIAFAWWIVAFPLAVLYFVTLFRIHRGKVVAASGRDGY
ncbi:MAG: cytochrome d ubiquinol oxidase subunit II [Acidobacteria bacterium]|nr:MAG: cytochrome d ubiquinol oxidase subunit II [Acidobacteriota bacterium]